MPLSAESLHFAFHPGRPVIRGVGFTLAQGAVTALVGPNGSGKSTLLRVLLGALRPTSGRATLDGRECSAWPSRRLAARVGYVPQRGSLAFAFTVAQVVRLGRYARGAGDEDAVHRALETVGLRERASEPYGALSAGQQQLATLARVLAQLDGPHDAGPPVILADEPVAAMDPRHAMETLGLFRDLASRGTAVLVVLHDLTLAARFADRAMVLGPDGRLAADGDAGEALDPARLESVFGVPFERIGRAGAGAIIPVPAAP